MENILGDFLIGILTSEVSLMLFFLSRKSKFRKFIESMSLLGIIMTPTILLFPLLTEYQDGIYFFLPIYLVALNGWLFVTRKYIVGQIEWENESDTKKWVCVPWYLLMAIFFVMTIVLVILIPHIHK